MEDLEYLELIIWDTGNTSCCDFNVHDKSGWDQVFSRRYFHDAYAMAIDDLLFFFHAHQSTWHYAVILYSYSDGFCYEVVKEFFFNGDGK